MSAFAIVQKNGHVLLTLTGPLTVERASVIKETFEQGLKQAGAGPLYFRVEETPEIDLSFIQILVAAQKTAQKNATRILAQDGLLSLLDEYLVKFGFTDFKKSLLLQQK